MSNATRGSKRQIEINVDGLIGPTHHFGGLGVGNLASQSNRERVSHPKAAALEGLGKMKLLMDLGCSQYYLPPLDRPNWGWLASLGFSGDRQDVLRQCYNEAPVLLSAAFSSAFMWTANAATVAPVSDTADGHLHVLPANLTCNLHRGPEALPRLEQLSHLLGHVPNVQLHQPLPHVFALRDEGAANHMRLSDARSGSGLHVFVYGPPLESNALRFVSRQSELASCQAAKVLALRAEQCIFVQQSREAIDAGVFHNDVIATSHENLFLVHEKAFDASEKVIDAIGNRFRHFFGSDLKCVLVTEAELSLEEAVSTYLFNSQIVRAAAGGMAIICPSQCEKSPNAFRLIQSWLRDTSNPIEQVFFLPLDQSMANGGGPACLRLRIVLTEQQRDCLGPFYQITESRIDKLEQLIERWYPEQLNLSDFARLDFAEHAIAAAKAIRHEAEHVTIVTSPGEEGRAV